MTKIKESIFRPKLFDSFKNYNAKMFGADLMSGTIVGIVALPLAIAFGIASGVTPEVGLITAIIGGFIVSILGGSNVQIGGPTGAFIVIVYGIIQQFGLNGLIVATLMAGVLLILMGILKLGSLVRFIPHPIIIGFTAGIAFTLLSTQVNDLFGLGLTDLPGDFFGKWTAYIKNFDKVQIVPLGIGLLSIVVILLTPKISKKIPGSLVAIVLFTALAYVLRLQGIEGLAFETIGDRFEISSNIPTPSLPTITLEQIRMLFPSAFTIALLCAIESLLSASVADGITGDRHRSNTELIAQGVANIAVPFFGGIPVTGAIARTMTNINNGGRTPVAGIVHAIVLLIFFLVLGPLMDYIPMACLAGILVVVAYNMSGWRSIIAISRSGRSGMLVMTTTFLLTVILDLTVAIEVGLLLSVFIFMKRMTETTGIEVSRGRVALDKDSDVAAMAEESLSLPKGVEVYEINGPYFFGIANRFEETMAIVGDKPLVRIIRMRRVPFMDSSAVHNLQSLILMSKKSGGALILSGVSNELHKTLETAGIDKLLGQENICSDIHLAIDRAATIVEANKTMN